MPRKKTAPERRTRITESPENAKQKLAKRPERKEWSSQKRRICAARSIEYEMIKRICATGFGGGGGALSPVPAQIQ